MNFAAQTVPPRISSIAAGLVAPFLVLLLLYLCPAPRPLLKQCSRYVDCLVWRTALLIPNSPQSQYVNAVHLSWVRKTQGRYFESLEQQKLALNLAKCHFGKEDETSIMQMTELAWCHQDLGDFGRAETVFREALKISEANLGNESWYTDRLLSCLAYLCERQGRYTESVDFNLQRLKFIQKDKQYCLNNLARVYRRAGQYSEAEKIYNQLLRDYPNQLFEIPTSLAMVYQKQGRTDEAESLLRKDLDKTGGTHIDALASFYKENGNLSAAENLFTPIEENRLILNHKGGTGTDRATYWRRSELADIYRLQGRHNKAEHVYKTILKEKQARLGNDHVSTAINIDDLAHLYSQCGRYVEAEDLYNQALQIRLMSLCKEHPDVGESFRNLACVCYRQSRYPEGDHYYRKYLGSYKQVLSLQERRINSETEVQHR